jgi:exodeoxyribonuclease-5
MQYTRGQAAAIDAAARRLRASEGPPLTIGGYAGTGKTEVIREIQRRSGAAVCAYTGKAVDVLRGRGVEAQTLHSLIYHARELPGGDVRFDRVQELPADAVVVDEASMLDADLHADLLSFGKPTVFVGDMGQLEPIGDDPRVMDDPDYVLDEILRQEWRSGIVRLAEAVRKGAAPEEWARVAPDVPDVRVTPRDEIARRPDEVLDADLIICPYNRTRRMLNELVRDRRGFRGRYPVTGDRLICLRNDRRAGLYNGMTGVVADVLSERPMRLAIAVDGGGEREVSPVPAQFGRERTLQGRVPRGKSLWDYGYAVTAHKAQGSEADTVAVYEPSLPRDWDAARWRYTAVTRAKRRLIYVTGG